MALLNSRLLRTKHVVSRTRAQMTQRSTFPNYVYGFETVLPDILNVIKIYLKFIP